ncbi:zinc-finger domain-containing protein [Algirhabdus cladophorae]|uniref:zinc-finger domain-containing protein n=1 Tax=Algirhabdus cladophorae TaxID=3377108 RepID=UPI003B8473D0
MTRAPQETIIVDAYRIACDGGGGSGGHPRVWLQIPKDVGWVVCPYCDTRYVHRDFEGTVD